MYYYAFSLAKFIYQYGYSGVKLFFFLTSTVKLITTGNSVVKTYQNTKNPLKISKVIFENYFK